MIPSQEQQSVLGVQEKLIGRGEKGSAKRIFGPQGTGQKWDYKKREMEQRGKEENRAISLEREERERTRQDNCLCGRVKRAGGDGRMDGVGKRLLVLYI